MTPAAPALRERRLPSGALHLNVVEWGEPDAPPIVLLHGLRGDGRTWGRTAAALSPRYRLIALDQRGRGRSDWDPACDYYTPAYVADLLAVVDALRLHRFILLGHSMGGATALMFTQAHPDRVRALVVEDIGPGSSANSAGSDRIKQELSSTPTTFASRDAARAYWRSSRPTASAGSIEDRLATMMVENQDGSLRWRLDMAGIAKARANPDPARIADLWPAVWTLRCPTLVMRGQMSDFLPPETMEAMQAANPLIRTAEIARASHYVHDDNFDDFIAILSAFIAGLGPGGPAPRPAGP